MLAHVRLRIQTPDLVVGWADLDRLAALDRARSDLDRARSRPLRADLDWIPIQIGPNQSKSLVVQTAPGWSGSAAMIQSGSTALYTAHVIRTGPNPDLDRNPIQTEGRPIWTRCFDPDQTQTTPDYVNPFPALVVLETTRVLCARP